MNNFSWLKFYLRVLLICLSIFSILQIGCASYQTKVLEARNQLKQGLTSEALAKLQMLAEKPSDDQLIYLLDYGTALQIAGKYQESNEVFLKADKLTEQMDYHSVSNIVSATLTSEEMVQYKGEAFEKYLINAMLAINYLMLNKTDDAMVECRRINEKISKMKMDGRKPYELNPFAKYLSALLWESDQKWDDAYIAYEESYKLDPGNPYIAGDLIRSAKRARRPETYAKWKKEFNNVKENPDWYDRNLGELVLIYQQGWGPEKRTRPDSHRFPYLSPTYSQTMRAKLKIEGVGEFFSEQVYNIEQNAIKTLEDDYGALVARRMGGIVAKEVMADQIRQKDELLGAVAWIAMHVSDRADLRQWSTLPRSIQMVRIPLKAGKYKIQIEGLSGSGESTADFLEAREIQVLPARKTFLNWRSLR